MKAALLALTAGSLFGSAFSIHARHAAFHQKKDIAAPQPPIDYGCCKKVVTVTVYADEIEPTSTVTWTSTRTNTATVSGLAKPDDKQKVPVPAAPPAYAPPAPPAYTPPTEAPKSPVEAPKPVESSKPPSSPGAGVITNGNKWAMTYTPYNKDGSCREAADVKADLAIIKQKGFTTVRLYGTDCGGLSKVGDGARAAGLKIILGIFIKGDGIEAARPQIGEIVTWGNAGNWDLVVILVVGNEAIHAGFADAASLAKFITDAKSALVAAGQGSIPVTTTDVVSTLAVSKNILCPVIDVIGANIQSFFDGGVDAASAGDFVARQLEQVASFCPGKTAYNLESGWPSGGGDNGASKANPEAQKAAIADIVAKVGDKTVVFSFDDDHWKSPGIEQHFGCNKLF